MMHINDYKCNVTDGASTFPERPGIAGAATDATAIDYRRVAGGDGLAGTAAIAATVSVPDASGAP